VPIAPEQERGARATGSAGQSQAGNTTTFHRCGATTED
jgi:hypothetical protein